MKIPSDAAGQRLDQALAHTLRQNGQLVSVREVRVALKRGKILIDGRRRAPGDQAQGEEEIALQDFVPRAQNEICSAPELLDRLEVLYEDRRLLALDKPSGIHTLPQKHLEPNTLLGAAIAHAPEIRSSGPPLEGGALHRLDYGTSGVVLFAKNATVRDELRAAFRDHQIKKTYLAIVSDRERVWSQSQIIDHALDTSNPKVCPSEEGLSARTSVEFVRRNASDRVLLGARTDTGRRHQIRVHLALSGTPILGDELYGLQDQDLRLALHASTLKLPSGLQIDSPLPTDLEAFIA